jgi:hypothetical protein
LKEAVVWELARRPVASQSEDVIKVRLWTLQCLCARREKDTAMSKGEGRGNLGVHVASGLTAAVRAGREQRTRELFPRDTQRPLAPLRMSRKHVRRSCLVDDRQRACFTHICT